MYSLFVAASACEVAFHWLAVKFALAVANITPEPLIKPDEDI